MKKQSANSTVFKTVCSSDMIYNPFVRQTAGGNDARGSPISKEKGSRSGRGNSVLESSPTQLIS